MHHTAEGYIDQDPKALRLTVINGEFDPTPYSVYATQQCQAEGIRITARVIGAGHVISCDTGLFQLHELFACVGLDGVPCAWLDQLNGRTVMEKLPAWKYTFQARTVPWHDVEPMDLTDLIEFVDLLDHPAAIGLVQEFPRGQLEYTPKTVIVISINGGVVIETAHSYPSVKGLVMTRSVLYRTEEV